MIKNKGTKFNDYSISPKIRRILLHWGYELVESDFFSSKKLRFHALYITDFF